MRSRSLEYKCLISGGGRATSNRRHLLIVSDTWIFMNDAGDPLYHLWIHYQILKTALYVSLSSVRITDVPIPATCPGGNVESVIEAGTVYWIARAFYKPVSDSKTHKQRCGPAERVAGATTCDTHTHIHILSFCHWQEQKNHISFAAVPKTNTISSSLSCRDLTMNVIDSSSVLTQVWRFLWKTSMHIHLKKGAAGSRCGQILRLGHIKF